MATTQSRMSTATTFRKVMNSFARTAIMAPKKSSGAKIHPFLPSGTTASGATRSQASVSASANEHQNEKERKAEAERVAGHEPVEREAERQARQDDADGKADGHGFFPPGSFRPASRRERSGGNSLRRGAVHVGA